MRPRAVAMCALIGMADRFSNTAEPWARGSVTGCYYLGGFVSYDCAGFYVADCEAWGNVSCTNSPWSVGGFIGRINENSTFLRCSVYGAVSSVDGDYGGFMGR